MTEDRTMHMGIIIGWAALLVAFAMLVACFILAFLRSQVGLPAHVEKIPIRPNLPMPMPGMPKSQLPLGTEIFLAQMSLRLEGDEKDDDLQKIDEALAERMQSHDDD